MKSTPKKIRSHLDSDMKGYKKEIKYLKDEIKEDKELKKGIKNGKKKKSCCKECEKGHSCEGSKSKPRKRVKTTKKTRRK